MPSPRESGPPNRPRRRPEPMPSGLMWVIVLLLFAGVMWFLLGVTSPGAISYTEFIELAKKEKFKNVIIRGSTRAIGELKEEEAKNLPEHLKKYERGNRLETHIHDKLIDDLNKQVAGHATIRVEDESGAWVGPFFMFVFPTLLIIAFFAFFLLPRLRDPLGGGFLNSYIKSPARRYDKSKM